MRKQAAAMRCLMLNQSFEQCQYVPHPANGLHLYFGSPHSCDVSTTPSNPSRFFTPNCVTEALHLLQLRFYDLDLAVFKDCHFAAPHVLAHHTQVKWPEGSPTPSITHAFTVPALAYIAAGKSQRKHLLTGELACPCTGQVAVSSIYWQVNWLGIASGQSQLHPSTGR